ncbi:hypothetical protein K474DRAFT_1642967 [Panus rudis PR-1116 ss-1]|nr:hypothetical protein K474DRAFT_1642967 [Panus rudis PR-1116 ss-1]
MSSTSYSYITEYAQLPGVVQLMQQSPYLIVDCEGQSIGTVVGRLSLLAVGTAKARDVFVIDVLALNDRDNPSLSAFLSLLEDEHLPKVMFDGRMDFVEIFHTYGTQLRGVRDLQVAEILTRPSRGEGEAKRLWRLRGEVALGSQVVNSNPGLLAGIHRVAGMDGTMQDFGLAQNMQKDSYVVQMHRSNQSVLWMNRPLNPRLLQYCANDINAIATLYEYFLAKGWIHPELTSQSARHISLLKSREEISRDRELGLMRFLALDVLVDPQTVEGEKYDCRQCRKSLPRSAYQVRSVQGQRRSCCRLCVACSQKSSFAIDQSWVNV